MKFFKNLREKPWANAAIAACIAVLFYAVITHLYIFGAALSEIYRWIRPVFLGLVISYVLNPLAKVFERTLFKKIDNIMHRRAAATAVTIITVILAIVVLLVLLIPQLVDSIRTFVSNIGGYTDSLQRVLQRLNSDLENNNIDLSEQLGRVDEFIGAIPSVITNNFGGIVEVTSGIGTNVADGVLAFIVAIYLMADKHRLMAVFKRLMRRLLSESRYDRLAGYWQRCNEIFVRFIVYDLLDGLIVGVANCVFMLIAGIPYSVLISVVVGVTNLAPTFGPVIGGAIGALILVLVNPWYALWFLIFTVVLQIVDGYVLKPKLFGGSMGVPAVWILITLIVGGRMLGVVGILLAIPVSAIVLFVCKEFFPGFFGDEQ